MKKLSKKALALILAMVMVFGVVPNVFPMAEDVQASEETTTSDEYDVYYEFDNMDLSTMSGCKSTRLDTASPYGIIAGEQNQAVTKHWFTGTADYPNGSTEARKIAGIKPNVHDTYWNRLDLTEECESYEVVTQVYLYNNLGIVLGKRDVFPGVDSGAVRVYFNNAQIQIGGSVDLSEISSSGEDLNGAAYKYGNYCLFKINGLNVTGAVNSLVTLHIKVKDGALSVWVDGFDAICTINLTDTYESGTISLWAKECKSGGGFKTVGIKKDDLYYNFENADLSKFAELKSTQMDSSNSYAIIEGQEDRPISEHWFTGTSGYEQTTTYENNGLKPLNDNKTDVGKSTYSMITLMENCKNFELCVDLYAGTNFGVALGNKNSMPGGGDSTGVRVYFANKRLQMTGTFNQSSLVTTGEQEHKTQWSGNTLLFNPSSSTDISNHIYETRQLHTLHVNVNNNVLTIWLDSYDVKLSITLADRYEVGTVSLYGNVYNDSGGGFKSVTMNVQEYYDENSLIKKNPALLTDFTSTQLDSSNDYAVIEGQVDRPVSEHWFTENTDTYYVNDTSGISWDYRNRGLKPIHRNEDNKYTLLTHNDTYENFKASYSFYKHATAYGLVFGAKHTIPNSADDSAVRVYPQNINGTVYLILAGAVDSTSAINTGSVVGDITCQKNRVLLTLDGFTMTSTDIAAKEIVTVNVKVQDGKVTASIEGMNTEITANLTGSFVDETVSLFSSGLDSGGFTSFQIEKLEDDVTDSVNVAFDVQVQGDYTAVTMSSDIAYSLINGNLKYDTSLYKYIDAVFGTRSIMINENKTFVASEGVLPVEALYNVDQEDKVVTLYFENISDTYDYSNLAFEDLKVIVSGGDEIATVNQTINVTDDYTGDKKINIVDLVKGKKEGATVTNLRKTLVGAIGETASPLVGKSLLVLGDSIAYGTGDQYFLSWAGRIAQRGMFYENVARSGWTLAKTELSGTDRIVNQLKNATKTTYDVVLLEGGVNDVLLSQVHGDKSDITWGEIENDLDVTEYNVATIAGAMQELIRETQKAFGTAEIVYVINSYYGANEENTAKYVLLVKEVCELHGISYVDLSDTSKYPELDVINNKDSAKDYMSDNHHPNTAGYDLIAPIIADFMEELILNSK